MRFPKPFFRAQTQSWYVQLGKQQINLGPDKNAALDQYNFLMAGRADLTPSTPAVYLLDRFLEWASRNLKPKTYGWYKGFLQSFAEHIGKRMRVGEVKPHHVTAWLDATG